MASNNTGVIASARKEVDFFEKIDRFIIVRPRLLSEAIEFLRKGDLNTEVGGLRELGKFQRVGIEDMACLHSGGAKMLFSLCRDALILGGDEFAVPQ